MNKPQIVILAAGVGSRMKEITNDAVPKCMVEINGKPMVQHQIEEFARQGFKDMIFCVGFLYEKITNFFGDGSEFGVRIRYSIEKGITEDSQLSGTAGAVKLAEDLIESDDVVIFYGDSLSGMDFSEFTEFHRQKNAELTIAARPRRKEKFSSIIAKDSEGKVRVIVEKPDEEQKKEYQDKDFYENNGIYVIRKRILEMVEPGKKTDFMKDIFPKLMEEGKPVYCYASSSFFREIGRPEKYAEFVRQFGNAENLFENEK